jgi:hypothetical protein
MSGKISADRVADRIARRMVSTGHDTVSGR